MRVELVGVPYRPTFYLRQLDDTLGVEGDPSFVVTRKLFLGSRQIRNPPPSFQVLWIPSTSSGATLPLGSGVCLHSPRTKGS